MITGLNKWGPIAGNLGFSNHFIRYHLRSDGKYVEYAKTYMNILKALKRGGKFHYAPSLPFIERYLDRSMFEVGNYDIIGCDFYATVVTKLKSSDE